MPPTTAKVLPDPDKWIAPKKAPPKQRPLVDSKFHAHHGVATPPTTVKKRGGASNKSSTAKPPASASASSYSKPPTAARRPRTSDATPTAPIRGIESYMTPKSTDVKKRTTTTQKRTTTTVAAAVTPTSTSENARRPKRRRDAADVIDLVADDVDITSAAAPRKSMTTPLLSRSDVRPRTPGTLDPKVDASVAQWMMSLPRKKSKPVDSPFPAAPLRTPEVPQSSLIEITPIPADVMARHTRLCGQDARPAGYVSPWRREGLTVEELAAASKAEREESAKQCAEEREHKRFEVREGVAERAVRRIEEVIDRSTRGEFQPLARLSSEDIDGSSSSPRRSSSPSDRRALEKPTGRASVPLQHPASLEPKPVSSRNDWPRHRPPPRFPPLRPPVGSTVTTPRKSRPSSHHHHITPPKVTPPKSRTPRQYGEQQETLFVFPPPRQPVFTKESVSPEKSIARWQAAEMEPETLMTWSLGGGGGGGGASMWHPPEADPSSLHEDPIAEDEAVIPATDVPMPLSSIAEDDDDIQSIAPSIPSQSFPHLIDASPSPRRVTKRYAYVPSPVRRPPLSPLKISPSPAKEPASFAPLHRTSSDTVPDSIVRETQALTRDSFFSPSPSPSSKKRLTLPPSPPPVPCKRLVRRVGAPPPNMHAFYSSLTSIPMARSDSTKASVVQGPSASRNRNRAAAAPKDESSQSKLESFGYFRDRASTAKKDAPAFKTAFSDEDDLDFGGDEPVHFSSPPAPTGSRRLVPVPDAPPHPSLRPAGVEAVEKRKAGAMARHREQQESGRGSVVPADDDDDSGPRLALPPASPCTRRHSHGHGPHSDAAFSTDVSSSVPSDEMPQFPSSTRAWWDNLGQMSDPSEFGGVTDDEFMGGVSGL